MVGNDVVDLNDRDADPQTLHPRFDARVFGSEELDQLRASARPVALRWRLWAAKEAAYKAVSKVDPGLVFSPSRFRVGLAPSAGEGRVEQGVVCCSSGRCRVELRESDLAIHAVAHFDPSGRSAPQRAAAADAHSRPRRRPLPESSRPLQRGGSGSRVRLLQAQLRIDPPEAICEDPYEASRAVRHFSRVRLAALLGVEVDELEIRSRGRIPELWLAGEPAEADLSLSHHGAVVAFACEVRGRNASVAALAESS